MAWIQKWVRWWFECKTSSVNRFLMSKNMAVEYPHVMIIDIRKFWIFRKKNPTVWHGCGQKWVRWWSECKTNSVNRFPVSKNMGVEYPHPMVINIQRFWIFHKKFPRSEMGVAALDFPKGLEFSNSHQFFYIPSRNISCTQTFIRNLFTDHTTFCL